VRSWSRGVAALLVGVLAATAPTSAAVDGDHILARTYLPSAERIHGELVLAQRGTALVMETLLYSNSLRRGADRIRKKELYYWPAGRPGSEDSARYLSALEQAKRHVLERFEHPASGDAGAARDPRPRLLIEFVLDQKKAQVVFYDVEVDATKNGFVVRDRRPIVTIDASPDYVARAIRHQADEGFDRPIADVERLPR
jgi:hypothetical protein